MGKRFAKIAPSVSGRAGTRTHITLGNAGVWGKVPKGLEWNDL